LRKVVLSEASGILAYIALFGSTAAVAGEVPLSFLVLFALAFAAGLIMDRMRFEGPLINPVILLVLVVGGILICLFRMEADLFNRALGILLLIISAKLISPKKPRDLLQLYLLNLLVVAAVAVTRWGLEFGLLVLGEAFLSVTGLVFIHGSGERREISGSQAWHLVGWSGVITMCLVPATVFFFMVIPRSTGMFFSWGGRSVARTGFSDRINPGAVEEIKVDPSPAFRVKWMSGRVPKRPLWRGVVYDTYSGGGWEKRHGGAVARPDIWADRVQYEILVEPSDLEFLLSYGLPSRVYLRSQKAFLAPGFTIQVPRPIERRTLYQVRAFTVQAFPEDIPPLYYLEIPRDVREGLSALAGRLAGADALGTAQAVASYLRKTYAYTLSPGEVPEGDPVLHFLFTGKKGHCEYFASAMVLLLRTLDVPARMVGGYLGGDWNEMGQYFLVRRSDAHTWVEVWIEGRGWAAFDPTPGASTLENPGFKSGMLRFVDLLRLKWYYWVLDYDLDRQLDLARKATNLLRSLRSGGPKWGLSFEARDLMKGIPLLVTLLLAFGMKIAWSRYRGRPRTRGERFVRVLERRGYEKKRGETLQELAGRVAEGDAGLGRKALSFVETYYSVEYGQEERGEASLDRLLREMGKRPRAGGPQPPPFEDAGSRS
jgi:transglutaminase-like putative cysteine protease